MVNKLVLKIKSKLSIIVISLFVAGNLYSQDKDSIVFHQSNARLFHNQYVFFKDGTFKHYFQTDDGQFWYGVGEFTDKGRKRILRFRDVDLNYKINFGLIHYESNFQRTLIKCGKEFKSLDYYHTSRKKHVRFVIK